LLSLWAQVRHSPSQSWKLSMVLTNAGLWSWAALACPLLAVVGWLRGMPVVAISTAPLSEIVAMVAAHWAYHAGEINAILAIRRGQAWEYGEEVEENHIATVGHRVRPAWMTDEQAAAFESHRTRPAPRR